MWPDRTKDGLYWPPEIECSPTLSAFTELYTKSGYKICPTWEFEDKFQKIAIYINLDTGFVTHAARQTFEGLWTSKIGSLEDIRHNDPFTIEGVKYGIASTFMKRENSSFRKK
jgi:hypothetical protein